jgi:hypothetical protein
MVSAGDGNIMFRALTFCDSPKILSALYLPAISSDDVLRRPNDGEGHSCNETLCVLCSLWIVVLDGRGVDADAMLGDGVPEL